MKRSILLLMLPFIFARSIFGNDTQLSLEEKQEYILEQEIKTLLAETKAHNAQNQDIIKHIKRFKAAFKKKPETFWDKASSFAYTAANRTMYVAFGIIIGAVGTSCFLLKLANDAITDQNTTGQRSSFDD